MTTIYVVVGTVGEHSDRSEWLVAAYADRALADKHADQAMLAAIASHKEHKDCGRESGAPCRGDAVYGTYAISYLDQTRVIHETTYVADYYVAEVGLRDELPTSDGKAPTAPDSGQPERDTPPPGGAGAVVALEPKS